MNPDKLAEMKRDVEQMPADVGAEVDPMGGDPSVATRTGLAGFFLDAARSAPATAASLSNVELAQASQRFEARKGAPRSGQP